MCKFHQDVAREIATDPATGVINYGHYSVVLMALSKYWVSGYMPGAANIEGNNPAAMVAPKAWAEFEKSGLNRPMEDVLRNKQSGIPFIRERMAELARTHDLSAPHLKIPPIAWGRNAYLDYGSEHLYEGPSSAKQLVQTPPRPEFSVLLETVRNFASDPKIDATLRLLLEGSVCTLYTAAKQSEGAHSRFHNIAQWLQSSTAPVTAAVSSKACCAAGAVAPAIVPALGSTLGAGLSFLASSMFAGASYIGWREHLGGKYQSPKTQVTVGALSAGFMVAVNLWSHSGHMNHDHNHVTDQQIQQVIKAADGQTLDTWKFHARLEKKSLEDLVRSLCATRPEILEKQMKTVALTP